MQYDNIVRTFLYIALVFCISTGIQSCLFERTPKDIDPFYTTRSFGDIPTMPLLKPVKLYYDRVEEKWGLEIPFGFNHRMSIDSVLDIGVEKTYIYGTVHERKVYLENYKEGYMAFVNKYNRIYMLASPDEAKTDEIPIYPSDPVRKVFLLPERWFVINVADSTLEAFFSKPDYKKYLEERGVSGAMYHIKDVEKEFVKTGILPWFPDSIKTKLRESK